MDSVLVFTGGALSALRLGLGSSFRSASPRCPSLPVPLCDVLQCSMPHSPVSHCAVPLFAVPHSATPYSARLHFATRIERLFDVSGNRATSSLHADLLPGDHTHPDGKSHLRFMLPDSIRSPFSNPTSFFRVFHHSPRSRPHSLLIHSGSS